MRTGRTWALAALLLTAPVGTAGCQAQAEAEVAAAAPAEAAVVETPAAGEGPARITLSARAEERLGVRTAAVTTAPTGQLVVPYSAVVYDADGAAWAFVRQEPRVYQRAALTVGAVTGDQVTLLAGPPSGTEVVTVGAAELVGAEAGISGGE